MSVSKYMAPLISVVHVSGGAGRTFRHGSAVCCDLCPSMRHQCLVHFRAVFFVRPLDAMTGLNACDIFSLVLADLRRCVATMNTMYRTHPRYLIIFIFKFCLHAAHTTGRCGRGLEGLATTESRAHQRGVGGDCGDGLSDDHLVRLHHHLGSGGGGETKPLCGGATNDSPLKDVWYNDHVAHLAVPGARVPQVVTIILVADNVRALCCCHRPWVRRSRLTRPIAGAMATGRITFHSVDTIKALPSMQLSITPGKIGPGPSITIDPLAGWWSRSFVYAWRVAISFNMDPSVVSGYRTRTLEGPWYSQIQIQ